MFQVAQCVTGGTHAWNDFHHTFAGTRIYDADSELHLIGGAWGGNAGGEAGAERPGFFREGFLPAIDEGGKRYIGGPDVHGGNVGPHERMDPISGSYDPAWHPNRVTAYYIAPDTFRRQGTGRWQGNTSRGLWEYPMDGDFWGAYGGGWTVRYDCSSILPSAECGLGY